MDFSVFQYLLIQQLTNLKVRINKHLPRDSGTAFNAINENARNIPVPKVVSPFQPDA
jgi:hypothetical protein